MRIPRKSILRRAAQISSLLLFLSAGQEELFAGTIDTQFQLRWAWSVAGDAIGYKGLEVVDLDSDGRAEILAAAGPWENDGYWYVLEREGDTLVQVHSSLPREDGVRGLAAGTENGRVKIVVAGASSLSVHDGATRRELVVFPAASTTQETLAVADVDADGVLDAVVCDSQNLYVYELLLGSVRTKLGFGCLDIAIGQTDGDPQLEIALAGNAAGGFLLDGASLLVDWADVRGFGRMVRLGDFDGDGLDEVASQISAWSGVRVQDPVSGALLWEIPDVEVAALAAGDIDDEAGSELLWGQGQWGSIHVIEGSSSAELRAISNPEHGVSAVAIGDTNADGVEDVVWGAGWTSSGPDYLFVASSDATSFAARTEDWRTPMAGVAVGDFLGDGSVELATAVTASESYYSGGVPIVLSFAGGRLLRFAPEPWPGPYGASVLALVSGQLDADPQLEMCLTGDQQLGCYDGAALTVQWLVSLADRAYALRLGELDGDPFPELVVGTEGAYVFAFESETGWLKWRSPEPVGAWSQIDRLRLLDVQGDTRQEVVATAARGLDTPLMTLHGSSGMVASGPWIADVLSLQVLPASPAPETLLLGQAGGSIVAFDPLTGVAGATIATFSAGVSAFGLADFNRDGTLDIAALLEHHFEIRDGDTAVTLFTSPYLGNLVGATESFAVGDFDGNSVPEILTPTGAGLALFQAPLFAIFVDGFESGDTSNW